MKAVIAPEHRAAALFWFCDGLRAEHMRTAEERVALVRYHAARVGLVAELFEAQGCTQAASKARELEAELASKDPNQRYLRLILGGAP